MLGLQDTLRILLSIELLAACEVDEDELTNEVALTGHLILQVKVLLAVFTAAHVPKEVRLERGLTRLSTVFARIHFDHEDGMTTRTLEVLRRLMNLTSVQRMLEQALRLFRLAEGDLTQIRHYQLLLTILDELADVQVRLLVLLLFLRGYIGA